MDIKEASLFEREITLEDGTKEREYWVAFRKDLSEIMFDRVFGMILGFGRSKYYGFLLEGYDKREAEAFVKEHNKKKWTWKKFKEHMEKERRNTKVRKII